MASPSSSSSSPSSKPKMYLIQHFPHINFSHSFRENVRFFMEKLLFLQNYRVRNMAVWNIRLIDKNKGFSGLFYVLEDTEKDSSGCNYCRSAGWSHHLMSKRRYHFIFPTNDKWDDNQLDERIYDDNHILHGLIHGNGFGHILKLNGIEGGSGNIFGKDVLEMWDRICTSLRSREISVFDVSKKKTMELRLLYGVGYGQPWFGSFGYTCSFGYKAEIYDSAIKILRMLELDKIIEDFKKEGRGDIENIIDKYRIGRHLKTLGELLKELLEQKKLQYTSGEPGPIAPQQQYKSFADVAKTLKWSNNETMKAAECVFKVLEKNKGNNSGMMRKNLYDVARKDITNTAVLNTVIASIKDCLFGDQIIRREVNPLTKKNEYKLEQLVEVLNSTVDSDMLYFYDNILHNYPKGCQSLVSLAVRIIKDCKNFKKEWPLPEKEDNMLRLYCGLLLENEGAVVLYRQLAPPELLVLPLQTTIDELKDEAEKAMRDTYCIMEDFVVNKLQGVNSHEPLNGMPEYGSIVWVRGSSMDLKNKLWYEGGVENYKVDCDCGAKDYDGERMEPCVLCRVWQHTRCNKITDHNEVPSHFLCGRCSRRQIPSDSGEEVVRIDAFLRENN